MTELSLFPEEKVLPLIPSLSTGRKDLGPGRGSPAPQWLSVRANRWSLHQPFEETNLEKGIRIIYFFLFPRVFLVLFNVEIEKLKVHNAVVGIVCSWRCYPVQKDCIIILWMGQKNTACIEYSPIYSLVWRFRFYDFLAENRAGDMFCSHSNSVQKTKIDIYICYKWFVFFCRNCI